MSAAASVEDDVDLVVQMGVALIRSGEAVDVVRQQLLLLTDALGLEGVDLVILPTAVFVRTSRGSTPAQVFASVQGRGLRLDQVSDTWRLLGEAQRSEIGAVAALAHLASSLQRPPPYGALMRTVGHGILSAGFALMLQASPTGLLIAFLLGIAVGVIRLIDMPELQPVMPVLIAFFVAAVTFALASSYDGAYTLWLLIPPLVTLLPGAAITTGTMELAAAQTVSGASRLIEGLVDLALLAFGIVTAAAVVGVPAADLLDQPPDSLGTWAPWVGLIVITAGHHLHLCAPRPTLAWILLVMAVAYGAQLIAAAAITAELAAFFGALAMTPLALWIGQRRGGPPAMVLFLPGFWLLVPGAAGLIGVTQYVGNSGLNLSSFADTLITVLEIALGVLLGTALHRAVSKVRSLRPLAGSSGPLSSL